MELNLKDRVWIGEMYSVSSPRRMMIGAVSDAPHGFVHIVDVLIMDMVQQQDPRTGAISIAWDMTPDPAFHSKSPTIVNTGLFLTHKVLDPIEDSGIISQYFAMRDKVRTARSGLIIPQPNLVR